MMNKVFLITGASSGMGKVTAKELIRLGHTVYAAARRIDQMQDIKNMGGNPLQMDITIDADNESVVNTISQRERRIDILINIAGYGSYGTVADLPLDEAFSQFEVKPFGIDVVLIEPGGIKTPWGDHCSRKPKENIRKWRLFRKIK